MDLIRSIIVDDEEGARDVLDRLTKAFCPELQICGKYANLEAAARGIRELKPQLVFLDIEMPEYAGYEIVSFFEKIDFEIIFVTAYDNYAIKAFEVSAVDYLLKPVDIERLKEATSRAIRRIRTKSESRNFQLLKESLHTAAIKNLVVAEKGDQNVIPVKEILAVEASESYSIIHTVQKTYIASKNLKHFEGVLTDNKNFFRCHKSWIINLDLIEKYSKTNGTVDLPNNLQAKLSKYRKEAFEKAILVQA